MRRKALLQKYSGSKCDVTDLLNTALYCLVYEIQYVSFLSKFSLRRVIDFADAPTIISIQTYCYLII